MSHISIDHRTAGKRFPYKHTIIAYVLAAPTEKNGLLDMPKADINSI